MKNTLPFLLEKFQNPHEWQDALRTWLHANKVEVSIEKVLMDMVLFHEIQYVAGQTQYKFFQGSVAATANSITNVVGSFARNQGEAFIIVGIRVMTGVNASLAATAWTYGATDATVQNATYDYINNTTQVLRNMPCTTSNPNLTTDDEGIHWLSEPLLWVGNTPIQLNLNLLNGLAVANTNIRFELIGFGLNA